jgi:hypothetical protein
LLNISLELSNNWFPQTGVFAMQDAEGPDEIITDYKIMR